MNKTNRTTIAVSIQTKQQILKLGKMGDTPNDVISQIIQENKHLKQVIKNSPKHLKHFKQLNQNNQPIVTPEQEDMAK